MHEVIVTCDWMTLKQLGSVTMTTFCVSISDSDSLLLILCRSEVAEARS